MDTFDTSKDGGNPKYNSDCERWMRRRSLPLFRARVPSLLQLEDSDGEAVVDPIVSALLVASGLGSFRASFDGTALSNSGPIDPGFTDYSRRVFYRAFDVTPFLLHSKGDGGNKDAFHVIGMSMGSGWFDHRPLKGGIVKFELLPRGPPTVNAMLYVTTASGRTRVVVPTVGGPGVEGDAGENGCEFMLFRRICV